MRKNKFLFLLFGILLLLNFFPFVGFAKTQDKIIDELIEISFALSLLKAQIHELKLKIYKLLDSSQIFTLADFLKNLFEKNEIFLSENDFLEKTETPYFTFAQILNLIPSNWQENREITSFEAEQISKKFLQIKDKIFLDRLYGKIDTHEHYWYGGNMEGFLKAAGTLGISKIVFLPTGLSPDNQGYQINQKILIEYYAKLYPKKIIPFCTIDESNPKADQVFEECLKVGGRGLKLIGGHPKFYDTPLNSEIMYKVYQKAAQYKVPVLLHGSIITIPELEEQLEQIFADFPDMTFIHAHYCSSIMKGINLEKCANLLDKHPNLYIDLSMGGGIKRYHRYFRQDLDKIKDFILTYQDRILFGSDIILNRSVSKDFDWLYQRIRCDIDLHQKENYTCAFGEKDLVHQGFNLPREVLIKLYYENPKRALNL
jgi:predicted TIM-barrel fold metal-dependent hydrolase